VVGGPAWHTLGAEAWAQFSLRADLGTGLIAYPVEAVGAALLLLIAAIVSSRFDHGGRRTVTAPLIAALALSALGLLFTAKAAPIMLSLGAAQPPAAVQPAFEDFFLWGIYLRGVVDVLAFVATVWALAAMCRSSELEARAG
jgi:hypothetical protein